MGSDHFPIIIEFGFAATRVGRRAPRWAFDNNKWSEWNRTITTLLRISQFDLIENPELAYHVFYNSLMEASHRVFRLIQTDPSKQREPSRPWVTQECKDKMKEAEEAKAEWIGNPTSLELFVKKKKAAASKIRAIKKTQRESWQKFASELDPRGANPKVWRFMKAMQGKGGEPSVDTANLKTDDGTTVTEAAAKAEMFLNFFDISSHLDSSHTTVDPSVAAKIDSPSANQLNSPFTATELEKALKNLKPTAMGADLVHNNMLDKLDFSNRAILLVLFNRMYASGFVPDSWKEATVIPLLKPAKDRQKQESYRAISLLSCLSKIFERLVNARLTWHLETKNLLPNFQSGFRKGRSTMDNLVDLEQRIKINMNKKKKTYAVFLDMSRAYDKVWIPGLLKKLARLGIDGELLGWLKKFLLGRSFRVRIGDLLSGARQLLTGVPQGAILSPLLFNIMLYDFPSAPNQVKTLLYADDVEADVTASTNAEAEALLNPYLDSISEWAREWRFDFSVEKSALVVFTRDAARHPPHLVILGNRIEARESVKFLGLTFDRKLQWKEHVENVIIKCIRANNALSVVARRKYGPTIQSLVSLHIALVRSQVDYGLAVYGAACNTRMEKIDVALRSSLRTILGAAKSTPTASL